MDGIDSEQSLFDKISLMIEQNKKIIASHANSTLTLMFWQIGRLVNDAILHNRRADYGKQIVSALATQLQNKYGRNFKLRNLRRMMQFAEQFSTWDKTLPR
ncbi:MAG: DUF1016 N-terminal domain-containing protein [Synergistaceae bacterium]|jgi:hypothetical protein|nr:DUF1016 N-terminal domain-containing protein [Synergistaceae bacterium]